MNTNLITINQLCQELGIGKTTAYKLIKSGKLKSGKIGSHIVVHRNELERYISEKTQTSKNS